MNEKHLPEVTVVEKKNKKRSKKGSSSTLFLVEKKNFSEKLSNEQALKIGNQKLREEVESWRSFAQALRIEDRQLLNQMFEKIWAFDGAVENCKEGYETEAFLLGLLILQQKTIDRLEEMVEKVRRSKKNRA